VQLHTNKDFNLISTYTNYHLDEHPHQRQ
jgi:hypothetical protein